MARHAHRKRHKRGGMARLRSGLLSHKKVKLGKCHGHQIHAGKRGGKYIVRKNRKVYVS